MGAKTRQALSKIQWIAELSRDSVPDGTLESPERVRELLNHIVTDVRAASKFLSDASDASDASDKTHDPYGLGSATPVVAANTQICLIHQATFLLRRQIQRIESDFILNGGFTESLYRRRRRPNR